MSEFKGTRGKWRVHPSEKFSNEFYIYDVDCVFGEQEANALLISKAPEMLAMLQELYEDVECWSDISSYGYGNKIEQLIKEVTEL
jgi:hypothetical protein